MDWAPGIQSETAEVAAPGKPYGLAAVGDELRVVVSIGEDDDRYFCRFVPGQGFDSESKTACPDFTGSQLASDGPPVYLAHNGNLRNPAPGLNGSVPRGDASPTRSRRWAPQPTRSCCKRMRFW